MLSCALALGFAPAIRAETLEDAVAAAYGRNPVLAEQRFRQKSVNEDYVQTRSQYGPTLSLGVDATYNYSRLRGRESESNAGQALLTARQPLYTGGRLRGALESARADVDASQEQLAQVEAETVQNVIIVYSAVLRDEQRVGVARENVAVLQDQLRENRARRRVEDVTLTDVAQADARLAAAEYQLANLEAALAISRGQYVQVVGHNPLDLQPLPDLSGLPETVDQAFALAETNNHSLAFARYLERASSANVAAVRGAQRPTVSLSAQGGFVGRLSPFDRRDYRTDVTGGLTLTQPLFTSGAVRSRIRQAQDNNDADQVAVDAARRQVLQDVTAAWSQLSAARVALASGLRQVSSAQIAFAGMQQEQRFGLRTTIEVLNAEQELQSAQLTLLQNRYQEYVARGALLVAIGALGARTVAPDINAYDAEAEFARVRNKGMTPLEPIAMAIDRIGSANPKPLPSPVLTGAAQPAPDSVPALPAAPDRALTQGPLVPITQSPLVPASALPDGLPPTGYVPPPRGAGRP